MAQHPVSKAADHGLKPTSSTRSWSSGTARRFPYTDANAQQPERVGSRPAAVVRFLGSYSTLGTACEVASRTVGLPVLAAGTSPYIDIMHGPDDRCRLVIIRTLTSG